MKPPRFISIVGLLAMALTPRPTLGQDLFRVLYYDTYFLQQESYLHDLTSDWEWSVADKGFRATAGSFTAKLFYFDLDFKLDHDLAPWLRFGYRRHQEDTRLVENIDHVAWLSLVWRQWSLGLVGMVEGYKYNNDAGFFVEYRESLQRRIRLSYLVYKPWYNSKNFDATEYQSLPIRYELEAVWEQGRWGVTACWWFIPAYEFASSDTLEEQGQGSGKVTGLYQWNGREHLGLELQWVRRHLDTYAADVQVDSENLHSIRVMSELTRSFTADCLIRLRAGYVLSHGNDYDQPRSDLPTPLTGFHFRRTDLLGVVESDYYLTSVDSLRLGFISDVVNRDAPGSRRISSLKDRVKMKLTGEYHRVFGNRGELVFLLSYQINDKGFGGGNLRMTIWV